MACLVLLAACERAVDSTSAPAPVAEPVAPLRFIVHPYDNPSQLVTRFSPLCKYLAGKLGQPVELVIARSYVDQVQRISAGDADLAYIGPTPFLRAQDHYLKASGEALLPLAAEARGDQASYQSVIVTRGDSRIRTLADLTDHSLALGSPHSFSSHYVPRVLLANAGLAFDDLRDFAHLGRHERVALAVLHGDFDAGGLNREVALRYRDRPPGLRILATSPPLPPHLVVARPQLPTAIAEAARRALLEPDTTAPAYREAITALGPDIHFVAPDMAPFERARRVIAAIESTPPALPAW